MWKPLCLSVLFPVLGFIVSSLTLGQKSEIYKPTIPKTWDDEAIRSFQLPLADPRIATQLISSSYYYSMPVRPIYKSYPVYRPDREPTGYMDQLKQKEPEIIFDSTKLKSENDWTRA